MGGGFGEGRRRMKNLAGARGRFLAAVARGWGTARGQRRCTWIEAGAV
jgi:hypothetical protein